MLPDTILHLCCTSVMYFLKYQVKLSSHLEWFGCLLKWHDKQEQLRIVVIFILGMTIQVDEFSSGVYKTGKIFAQKTTYRKEIIEYWELKGKVSKSAKIK